ncbi:hypothetical protein BY996DRAFT_730406 [Phakopsora pachyrhizi]|nr:hypothetical protein BY996DRAFT_730406 [Phakopsora pachyrhizi]
MMTKSSDPNRSQHLLAVEIDNESLRADLKYTREKLSEAQEQVYQLQDQLSVETQSKQDLMEKHELVIERFKVDVKQLKKENLSASKDKEALQIKLNQVEARFKECLETMENERIELEGLRDEMLGAQPRSTFSLPTNNDDDDSKTEKTEDDETMTISKSRVSLRRDHASESSSPFPPTSYVNRPKRDLERELETNRSRIQELESMLRKQHRVSSVSSIILSPSASTSSSESSRLNVPIDSSMMLDQEKMFMITKYQRLLSIKDEENLGLLNRIQELEEQLMNPRNMGSRRTTLVRGHGKSNSGSGNIINGIGHRNSLLRVDSSLQQQILGLKLIVNQSNEDRVKVEQENRKLRNQIEELKQSNHALENQVGQLIDFNDYRKSHNNIRDRRVKSES